MSETTNKPPVQKYRAGVIEVSIWEREGENGKFYNISHHRNYKDKADEWQQTTSYRVNDLPVLQMLLTEAYKYCKMSDKEVKD